ncbi:hypothetical protein D1007_59139 [Hordeum vulgare]|nr:hypothetical protein D1007_59139 [Hordeum vulgare]
MLDLEGFGKEISTLRMEREKTLSSLVEIQIAASNETAQLDIANASLADLKRRLATLEGALESGKDRERDLTKDLEGEKVKIADATIAQGNYATGVQTWTKRLADVAGRLTLQLSTMGLPGFHHEGHGRPIQDASGDHETDPTLLHLVRYLRAQEALYDHATLDLVTAHTELARLRRREAETEASNPIVLFRRPIELQRSIPATDPSNAPISPDELHRILGICSNETVATTLCNGHPRYPDLVAPPPSLSNRDAVVPADSTSTRPAQLNVNEVD